MTIEPFNPPKWLHNRHLQSIYSRCLPSSIIYPTQWHNLSLPDGDFIEIVYAGDKNHQPVILMHGMEGSINSNYMHAMINELVKANFFVVCMHFRDCGRAINKHTKAYCAAYADDLVYLIDYLTTEITKKSVHIVAFSLSGNLILKYLQDNTNPKINRVAAVSTLFDLAKTNAVLPRLYDKFLLNSVKKKAMRKLKLGYDMPVSEKQLRAIESLEQFDDVITAPLFGYEGAADYYQKASCRPRLHQIKQPTLILNAKDDPFIPANSVPDDSELATNTQLYMTEYGGHIGFIEIGAPWKPVFWYPRVIRAFLEDGV